MQLTRELMNSWLCKVYKDKVKHVEGGAKWKDQDYSSGWKCEMCNSGEETVWLLAWKSSSAAACWGKGLSGERMVWEPQGPVLGWKDPLTSFDCLWRRIEGIRTLWKLQWDCFKFAGSLFFAKQMAVLVGVPIRKMDLVSGRKIWESGLAVVEYGYF